MKLLEKAFLVITLPTLVVLAAMGVVMGSMPLIVKLLDAWL